MPLPESPRLDIDVRQRRAERWIAVISTSLAPALPWLLLDSLAGVRWASAAASAGLLIALILGAGFHRAGWLAGSRRIARMVWSADGFWVLIDTAGRAREACLAADTRIGPGCVWLRWQTPDSHSMLLLPGDAPPDQLRRLLVRLRIDRQQADAVPRGAAI